MLLLLLTPCASEPRAAPAPPAPAAPTPAPAPPPPLRSPDGVEMAPCLSAAPPGMACVPGGPFVYGVDLDHACAQGENARAGTGYGPRVEVWVQTFYMDVTEVTIEAWRACVAAGHCPDKSPAYNDYDRPRQPMVGMSWQDADAYCRSVGQRLPTEAEWEKAARGPDGDPGPFGPVPSDCGNAVVRDATGRSCGVTKKDPNPEKGRTWEVAGKPIGRYGLYDMVGNAEEYVADWFAADRASCGAACAGTDPRGPCAGEATCPAFPLKMVKGGSWYWGPEHATGWHRRPHVPTNHPYHHFGFRCAASLGQAAAKVGP